jgi:hypothetical protein
MIYFLKYEKFSDDNILYFSKVYIFNAKMLKSNNKYFIFYFVIIKYKFFTRFINKKESIIFEYKLNLLIIK